MELSFEHQWYPEHSIQLWLILILKTKKKNTRMYSNLSFS